MTNKRNQYTREFKLEAISLVTDHNRSIPDVSDSLGIGKIHLTEMAESVPSRNGWTST